jgi:hypothetical protein
MKKVTRIGRTNVTLSWGLIALCSVGISALTLRGGDFRFNISSSPVFPELSIELSIPSTQQDSNSDSDDAR